MAKSSLLANEDLYITYFANTYYDLYRTAKFGIKSCKRQGKVWLDTIRKELLDYQALDQSKDVCNISCNPMDPSKIVISYTDDSCCSKSCAVVNVNKGTAYVWTQAVAANVWTIKHNLDYVPNVFAEDAGGADIVGVVGIVNNNEITITFNSPVAGKAYLS